MSHAEEKALVGIMNSVPDFLIARDQGWYRVRLANAERLREHWPPEWLAFYHTRVFPDEQYTVRYIARVNDVRRVTRPELFPDEPINPKSRQEYYKLSLGPLEELPHPIPSRRLRCVTFIPTTYGRLMAAAEINDLWLGNPLQEAMWQEFRRLHIPAEREHPVQCGDALYFLDFAVYCASGNLGVETDGDFRHVTPERAAGDLVRDNSLGSSGWRLLRFNSFQVREQMNEYCIPTILSTITRLGGLEGENPIPERSNRKRSDPGQLGLFEGE